MRRFLKPLATAAIVGAVLGLATCLFPYAYCGDGNGRGIPFAIHHPHKGRGPGFEAFSSGQVPCYIDIGAFVLDTVAWSVVVLAAGFLSKALVRLFRLQPQERRE